jgi:hypothetical protein
VETVSPNTVKKENRRSGDRDLKKNVLDKKERPAMLKVEEVQNLSVDDFSYDRGSLTSKLQVCQLRTKSGELMWVPMEDYLRLKHEYARLASSDESECDDVVIDREGMNQQNVHIGR